MIEKEYEGSKKRVALKDVAPSTLFRTDSRHGHVQLWCRSSNKDEEGNIECLLIDDMETGSEGALVGLSPDEKVVLPRKGKLFLQW